MYCTRWREPAEPASKLCQEFGSQLQLLVALLRRKACDWWQLSLEQLSAMHGVLKLSRRPQLHVEFDAWAHPWKSLSWGTSDEQRLFESLWYFPRTIKDLNSAKHFEIQLVHSRSFLRAQFSIGFHLLKPWWSDPRQKLTWSARG